MQWIQIDGVRINVDKIVSYKKVDNKTVIKMVDFDKIESEKLEPEALDAVISSFAILNDFDASETEENEEDDNNFKDDILE